MTPPASPRRHRVAFLAAGCLALLAGLVLVAGDGFGQAAKKETKDKKEEKKETKAKKEEKKEPPKEEKKEPPKDKTPPLLVLKGNTDWVNSVAFSPDGKWLVTAGRDRTVRLWDSQSGKEVRAFGQLPKAEPKKEPAAKKEEKKEEKKPSPQAGPTNIRDAQFSPDGSKIASTTGGWNKGKKEWVGEVRLWDAQSGKELAALHGHTDEIECVAFSPDGKRLATGSKDMTAKVWDLAQAKDVQTLKGHTGAVLAVAFNKDGTRLATAGDDGTVRVWDVASGKEVTGDKGGLRLAGLAELAAAPPKEAKAVKAPEPKDKKGPPAKGKKGPEPKVAKEPPRPMTTVAYSRDGSKLAAANTDGIVLVWDAASGKGLQKIKGPEGVWSVAFSPDGQRLAEGGWSDLIKVWDVATGKELLQRNGHDRTVTCVAFSPDGQRLATAGIDGLVKIWPVIPKK